MAIEDIGWARHVKKLAFPAVDEITDGNLHIKVFYGGVLGDDEEVIAKMASGMLQGAGLAGLGAGILCPEMNVVQLPFLFENYEEVDHIKAAMKDDFDLVMEKNGYFLLIWMDQDFDQVLSSDRPMARVEDFSGVPFITWQGELEKALLQRLGAEPISVRVTEVSSWVRQGNTDAAIGPAIWVVGAQLHNRIRYINPMKIRYSPSAIVVTLSAWRALPVTYRNQLLARQEALTAQICEAVRRDNQECLEALYAYGLIRVEPTPGDMAALKTTTRPLWNQMAGSLYPQALLDKLLDRLAEFRASRKK